MSARHTVLRSLHDVGLAAWFGGSLMGAVGLNGAAKKQGADWQQRARIASAGWSLWAPVGTVAIGAHLAGSGGLLGANATRVLTQQGLAASTLAKTALTGAALAATVYGRVLGKKIELASAGTPQDAEKAERPPANTGQTERHLSYVRWAVPALTCGLIVLNALHAEQQRPAKQLYGMLRRARTLAPYMMSIHHWHRAH
ncbi:hypothetical protein Slala03_81790 [Streptomyces lavendulae subsp. lavendulae]|uniref:hypothetical protein n=1 Tax=Streptomyces lavendulae TaxID=1914 RepID=UPI0024A1F0A9|nr:hypothetical protein [Streptomyces lavendulae]GLV88490.1 hypothetical protein Slala03_81790 [Streptomyces lavendulae subsp. lavendulae]